MPQTVTAADVARTARATRRSAGDADRSQHDRTVAS